MRKLSRKQRNLAKIARRVVEEEERPKMQRTAEEVTVSSGAVETVTADDELISDSGAMRQGYYEKKDRQWSERLSDHGVKKQWQDRPKITEMVREATAGGVVYRITKAGTLQVILYQDARDRWTIPKGHIEEGETAQETAIREIGEEVGMHAIEPTLWLGKVHFRYRREATLVLMTTQVYLFRAIDDNEHPVAEEWMHGARWFDFDEAIEAIAYEDIAKLVLLARNRLRQRGDIE
jgi:8-oxo-dGTP pyrophosphatase MutT (NUDIX family)